MLTTYLVMLPLACQAGLTILPGSCAHNNCHTSRLLYCREIMETNEKLRDVILGRLLDSFSQIRSSRVCSCSLWIIGEYCRGRTEITSALEVSFPAVGVAACRSSGRHAPSICWNHPGPGASWSDWLMDYHAGLACPASLTACRLWSLGRCCLGRAKLISALKIAS